MTFQNRKALVTGAGRGIGKAIAEDLARHGVEVICVSRTAETCGSVAEGIRNEGGRAESLALDVADANAVKEACRDLLERHKVIDILVNNAGITRDGLLFRMSDADWHDVINTNLSSVFYWTRNLSRPMTQQRWGRIVNITSVSGLQGNAGQVNYAASKAGMIGLTKSVAREFSRRSVTCNAIAPGFIKTDMSAALAETASAQILDHIPLRRFGEAGEVARLATYLCSEEAGYVTGQVFTIDGGMVM